MAGTVRILTGLAAGVTLAALATPADAIPAFARKYSLSCTTCHAPFPRLNAFGEDFAGRGFRMPDAEVEAERGEKPTGDPLLKLLKEIPLAIRAEAHMASQDDEGPDNEFEAPWVFKVLSGGPIGDRVSYYGYFIVEKGEVIGLEDAYLHFQQLFGTGIDVLFGQFQVSDPLFKREVRLARADYEIYRTRVGAVRANLTYDRGLMFFGTAPGDVDVVFQVVNGNGIPEGEFDEDGNKNLALRLAREFGRVRLGLFGYWGEEEAESGFSDTIEYFGPDLRILFNDKWDLGLQYLVRNDDDPFFLGPGAPEVETKGGFAELVFLPQGSMGRWTVTAVYNKIESDDPAAVLEDVALSASYLYGRNLRIIAEVGDDIEHDGMRASLGVITAF
jgi:hypothetical protein